METLEGVPALFLLRHYLELRLKLIVFHARWLNDQHTTARDEDIQAVKNQHSLKTLWVDAKQHSLQDLWANLSRNRLAGDL